MIYYMRTIMEMLIGIKIIAYFLLWFLLYCRLLEVHGELKLLRAEHKEKLEKIEQELYRLKCIRS
jgi:hypothetical protein